MRKCAVNVTIAVQVLTHIGGVWRARLGNTYGVYVWNQGCGIGTTVYLAIPIKCEGKSER